MTLKVEKADTKSEPYKRDIMTGGKTLSVVWYVGELTVYHT